MKNLLIGTSGLLASGPLLAHLCEHSEASFFSIILHLIAEHPLPLILVAGIVGVVTVRRLLSD